MTEERFVDDCQDYPFVFVDLFNGTIPAQGIIPRLQISFGQNCRWLKVSTISGRHDFDFSPVGRAY